VYEYQSAVCPARPTRRLADEVQRSLAQYCTVRWLPGSCQSLSVWQVTGRHGPAKPQGRSARGCGRHGDSERDVTTRQQPARPVAMHTNRLSPRDLISLARAPQKNPYVLPRWRPPPRAPRSSGPPGWAGAPSQPHGRPRARAQVSQLDRPTHPHTVHHSPMTDAAQGVPLTTMQAGRQTGARVFVAPPHPAGSAPGGWVARPGVTSSPSSPLVWTVPYVLIYACFVLQANVAPSLFFRVMNMWFLPRAYVLLLLLSVNNRAFSIERKARKDSSPFQASHQTLSSSRTTVATPPYPLRFLYLTRSIVAINLPSPIPLPAPPHLRCRQPLPSCRRRHRQPQPSPKL
jgi:hypothetical protein